MASSPTISIDAIDAIDEENFKLLDKLGNFEINNTGFEDDPDLMQAMISSTFYLEKKTVSMNIYMISKFIANIIGGGGKWNNGAKWDAHKQIQICHELLNIWQYNFISD